MQEYTYKGPVLEFGKCISNKWEGTTWAATERRARNNLAYRFKQQNNRMPSAKITLPGEMLIVRGED